MLGKFPFVETRGALQVWVCLNDGCILQHPATSCRERQRWGKIRCRLAQCAFAPTVTFTAASSHWEDRLIRSCVDPRLLSVCHFSLSLVICSTFYCIFYVFKLLIFSIIIFCLQVLHIFLSSILMILSHTLIWNECILINLNQVRWNGKACVHAERNIFGIRPPHC